MSRNSKKRILIADDEPAITEGLSALLGEEGYDTGVIDNGHLALAELESNRYELLLVDLKMPGLSGLEVLEEVKKRDLAVEVIIITGQGTIDSAVDAMKSGAYDYLTKPVEPNRLRTIVTRALEHQHLVAKTRQLEQKIQDMTRYGNMVGQDEKMLEVYRMIDAVAGTTANVLVTGESGTGKELVAQAIHDKSDRAEARFVAVNASAFPRDILENELFGHEKGAFTGALAAKAGCFEMANSGTLFLDEIGEMSADTQAKLLRALETKTFRRLGGTKEIHVDVRVIAATNRNIKQALKDGSMREDLYYRLSVVEIHLPPLRDRLGDLPLLVKELLNVFNTRNSKSVQGFSPDCLKIFKRYTWPGNIRELRNVVERAVILCDEDLIDVKHLPAFLTGEPDSEPLKPGSPDTKKTLHDIEKDAIFSTLKMTGNNKTKAAQILGISLKTLHNKLNRYYQEEKINH